jgi:hypothetical protein
VQRTRSQELRPAQCGTGNPERTDVREETLEGPRMQQWHKGPRPKTAATRQQANKRPRRQVAAISEEGQGNHERHRSVEHRTAFTAGKQRNAHENPILDFQREDQETSSRNVQWVTKNDGGVGPLRSGKRSSISVRGAGDVEPPATPGFLAPPVGGGGGRAKKRTLDYGENLD